MIELTEVIRRFPIQALSTLQSKNFSCGVLKCLVFAVCTDSALRLRTFYASWQIFYFIF